MGSQRVIHNRATKLNCVIEFLDFSQQHYYLSSTIMPILQMRKPSLRLINWFGQEHVASLVLKMELKK